MKKILIPLIASLLLCGCTKVTPTPEPGPGPEPEPQIKERECTLTAEYFTAAGGSGYVDGEVVVGDVTFYASDVASNSGKFKGHDVIQFRKETGCLYNEIYLARNITITYRLQGTFNQGGVEVDPNHELTLAYSIDMNDENGTVATSTRVESEDSEIAIYNYQIPEGNCYYTIKNLSSYAQYIDSIVFSK